MGFEEEFQRVLGSMNFSGSKGMADMLKTLVTSVEIDTLKKMRKALDDYIKALQAQVGSGGMMDPYVILGVSKTATKDEVTRAYRTKSFNAHPDRGGSNSEMAKVNAAYEAIRRLRGWK